MASDSTLGAVVIGRNEGQRLVRCLASLKEETDLMVYGDAGDVNLDMMISLASLGSFG